MYLFLFMLVPGSIRSRARNMALSSVKAGALGFPFGNLVFFANHLYRRKSCCEKNGFF